MGLSWLNIFALREYARRHGHPAYLYAIAALLCLWNTYVGILLTALVQLQYALRLFFHQDAEAVAAPKQGRDEIPSD